MSWFKRGSQSSNNKPQTAGLDKLAKLSASFASIQNMTAPILRLGRIDQTLNLSEALLSDRSLDPAQRRTVNIITSKAASLAIPAVIKSYGIFDRKWYIQQYFQKCLEAEESVYTPGGLVKASQTTTDLRSATAAWNIIEQFHTDWVETRKSGWDIWLERAIGRSSLRQFAVFRKSRYSIYCALASKLHHDALRASDSGDFYGALSMLAEGEGACCMAVELEEALNGAHEPTDDIFSEAEDISASYEILRSTCTASRSLKAGHKHFDAALMGNPDRFMDNSLLALDDYRLALSCATNKDIELEAESVFYLAKTCQTLLKSEVKAHELYIRAVSLVTTLSPKLPGGTWFMEAKQAIEARRAKMKAQEDSEWYLRREPVYQKVKDIIDEIHEKSIHDARALVTWIMTTHPPKTEGDSPDLTKPASQLPDKRLVVEAIRRYHPDKNTAFGDEWHVISEEITKSLNACFETVK